jgi:hypothetical protein
VKQSLIGKGGMKKNNLQSQKHFYLWRMKKIVLIVWSLLCIGSVLNAQSKDTFAYHYLPLKYRLKVDVLTENICNAADKDQKRVENIFYWVSHYIKVDVKNYNKQIIW